MKNIIYILTLTIFAACGFGPNSQDLIFAPIENQTQRLIIQNTLGVLPEYEATIVAANVQIFPDEQPELVVTSTHPDYCGNSGCMYAIFAREKNRLELKGIVFAEKLEIRATLQGQSYPIVTNNTLQYLWDGKTFVEHILN